MRKILVTSALPYANGDIHIGHLVEYIQTDIYVRFQKLVGNNVIYMCASDAHGTPIEINASKRGISPEQLVSEFHSRHREDFARFEIGFDEFYTTDSPENQKHSETIFFRARDKGHIVTRDIEQYYCESCGRFLPDRYIKGTCPKCGTEDQYGDVCESCGATYRPTELANARCAICGAVPSLRTSKHFFFQLKDFSEFLVDWTSENERLQSEVVAFVRNWIDQGLQDWDISRDGPYFGFRIPGEEDKYFYVWLDAPIGYIAATEHYCSAKKTCTVEEYWLDPDSEVEIHHFIGKDIAYFHTLFWPAMLRAANYRLPTAVHVHGFLTVDSRKMSKSRGTFITARSFADHLNPWYLRYYYATKLSNTIDDLDLHIEEFVNRTNAELVNNITNLVSRTVGFLNKRLASRLGIVPEAAKELIPEVHSLVDKAFEDYGNLRFGMATRSILSISDIANNYVQQNAPWTTIKENPERARNDLTFAANCIKVITVLLKPILPAYCEQLEQILGVDKLTWQDATFDLENREIRQFEKLVDRLEPGAMDKLIEASRADLGVITSKAAPSPVPEFKEEVTIEDFSKVDLRAGKVVAAEAVEGSDKLLKLTVDLGVETRTVFAGIRSSYNPEEVVGRSVVVVANLKPRKMRFGVSEGMVLAASGANGIVLCALDESVAPGSLIR
ncbi:methionine--tRNA ligase [Desulfomonile tiedjei]|uniref:Methionine--tRNA ligase n=1 Tax=Desulfomonile tiedjei (strain ATCC 49306 / DSM 6799 / DCB-1) TaxID=706587 RepID=I4C339_DESTA|nr:methionine--tRNA ligase [Desulfomonile tiedjei]AFM23980.1 protein containing C-terminal region/beta chain of methionyl-tRNA synthetase [Desulfomonile tiedjei DSM 6799]